MNELDRFFEQLPPPQAALALALHHFLLEMGLKARWRYGLPFYDGRRWLCYVRPRQLQGDLELCFTRAHQFEDPTGLLCSRGRKQIKGVYLSPGEDLPLESLQAMVAAALALDRSY